MVKSTTVVVKSDVEPLKHYGLTTTFMVDHDPPKLTTIVVNFVEAMPSKVILMMPKNQELSKLQRFKNQVSRIKIQDSRIKFLESRFKDDQDQDSRLKIQESREDSIKISTKKVFQNIE